MARQRRTFIRSGHGAGKGKPHVEVPTDSLPKPVAAAVAETSTPLVFRDGHKIGDSETAREMQRRSVEARVRNVGLLTSLGMKELADDNAFVPYRDGAKEFTSTHCAELARIAGGKLATGPTSMVASAALQLAGSRFCFDKFAETGDASWIKLGSQLANDSRQNLLAAYSHAVLEADSRKQSVGDEHLYEGAK